MKTNYPLHTILHQAITRLQTAGCDTPRLDAELLLGHVLGQSRTWLKLNHRATLTTEQAMRFTALLDRRAVREPVAYLLGERAFFARIFQVTPAVLITRPETELLIETALAHPNVAQPNLRIIDVGTGSGCIAITLALELPHAQIIAVDKSPDALAVAQANATRHGVADRINFRHSDLLNAVDEQADLLVSNPPYVTADELAQEISPEVSQFEPRLALDGGDKDGLAIIRRLFAQASVHLKPKGRMLVEIGAGQGAAVQQIAQTAFPHGQVSIKTDLARLDRLVSLDLV